MRTSSAAVKAVAVVILGGLCSTFLVSPYFRTVTVGPTARAETALEPPGTTLAYELTAGWTSAPRWLVLSRGPWFWQKNRFELFPLFKSNFAMDLWRRPGGDYYAVTLPGDALIVDANGLRVRHDCTPQLADLVYIGAFDRDPTMRGGLLDGVRIVFIPARAGESKSPPQSPCG